MNIGERIKRRRAFLGMSVDELAAEVNKNRATIYRYEKGDIENLPTTVLEPLAEALETTPAYLMGWTDDPRDYENDPDIQVPDEFLRMGWDAEKYTKWKEQADAEAYREHIMSEEPNATELDGVYLSLAKEAQQNGIKPEDIKLAIETIKQLRGE